MAPRSGTRAEGAPAVCPRAKCEALRAVSKAVPLLFPVVGVVVVAVALPEARAVVRAQLEAA